VRRELILLHPQETFCRFVTPGIGVSKTDTRFTGA
jgi:hypothetical protein